MSATDWGLLVPGILGLLGAVAAWLRAQAAKTSAAAAHQRINQLTIKQTPPPPVIQSDTR